MKRREIPLSVLGDAGWRGALHILTSPLFEDAPAVWSRVNFTERSIDFEGMLAAPWSGGELRMLRIAASLFNPQFSVALWSDLGGVDDVNATVALEAMAAFVWPAGAAHWFPRPGVL